MLLRLSWVDPHLFPGKYANVPHLLDTSSMIFDHIVF